MASVATQLDHENAAWRSFAVSNDHGLLARVLNKVKVQPAAEQALLKKNPPNNKSDLVATIVVTPRIFGFDEGATLAQMLNPFIHRRWTAERKRLYGTEDALHPLNDREWLSIRLDYLDQSRGECLYVATEGSPSEGTYVIGCDSASTPYVHLKNLSGRFMFRPDDLFLFRLERSEAASIPTERIAGSRGKIFAASHDAQPTDGVFLKPNGEFLTLDEIQDEAVRQALLQYDGRISEVCRKLEIGRSTLYRRYGHLFQQ